MKREKINVEEVEKLDKISVYLENGKVWEAFFKKDKKNIFEYRNISKF